MTSAGNAEIGRGHRERGMASAVNLKFLSFAGKLV
jgi:hypothetical protein